MWLFDQRDGCHQDLESSATTLGPEWKDWVEKKISSNKDKKRDDKKDASATANNVTIDEYAFAGTAMFTISPQAIALNSAPNALSLKHRWIFDTGTTTHVCNDRDNFVEFTEKEFYIRTGDTCTRVAGYGTAVLTGADPYTGKGIKVMAKNALYSPNFHTNLISYSMLKKRGWKWDEYNNCVRDPDHNAMPGAVPTIERQLEYHQAHVVRISERPLVTEGSAEIWHRRLAHIQPSTVKKAAEMVDGIKITGNEESKGDQQLCEGLVNLR
ncbi:hypothetical protein N7449_001227 [Penicillium cf. viridicatum]|uniref:Retrovirus-related Pol polyprotein from transposon TNT 1-94-like beta-barrel domain-containing protein n=1 Tax=Penicillium cf. viridicatum TaxID=2972119 RepID=A0A9W9N7T4_9EURO|nr:hypothetical protein N7449_001227 [Penicillium cf. viridicatum]